MDGVQLYEKKIIFRISSHKYTNLTHKQYPSSRKRKNIAISEIVGILLLLGISIGLFTTIYYSFIIFVPQPNPPVSNLLASLDDETVIVEHWGGDSIPIDSIVILNIGGSIARIPINEIISSEYAEDGLFSFSEYFKHYVGDLSDYRVEFQLIDKASNSLISRVILQDGVNE